MRRRSLEFWVTRLLRHEEHVAIVVAVEETFKHTHPLAVKDAGRGGIVRIALKKHVVLPKTVRTIAMLVALLVTATAARAQGNGTYVVRDQGFCGDVISVTCAVRDFYPRELRTTAVGTNAYWFANAYGQVCFVTPATYLRTAIGERATCIWRDRRP